ncbi:DinB family protein [uncultured Fibrella sp.]|uniref:DinB family protein n=1 Tax=uncultured Fibrella sp. TaxID=1284596 RepID=UPI0035C9BE95
MQLPDIRALLTESSRTFSEYAAHLSEEEFADRPNNRWSVGDTAQHLFLSSRPIVRLLAGPRDVFGQWGFAEGLPRTYEAVDELYRQVLGKGVKAPVNLSPRPDDVPEDKATMLARLNDTYLALAEQVANWSENELDRYQIPHPALGLISVRDMLYFVTIHTQHHIAVLRAY